MRVNAVTAHPGSSPDLAHRTVLVTGAARGIGRAIATAAAAAGARVALLDIDGGAVEQAAEALIRAGGSAFPCRCDVAEAASRDEALEALARASFSPDVLVNNAGVQIVGHPLALNDDAWRATMAVNLEAPFRLAQRIGGHWVAHRIAGAIVNIASIAGTVHFAGHAAYSASKAGLRGLTGALALELAPHGIRVNAVAPGHVDTAMSLVARDAVALTERLRTIPLGRLAHPDDIARVVVFLASRRASYVTGQTITVDGGYSLR